MASTPIVEHVDQVLASRIKVLSCWLRSDRMPVTDAALFSNSPGCRCGCPVPRDLRAARRTSGRSSGAI